MSSITNVRLDPVYDPTSGALVTQVAETGNSDPRYITRSATTVRVRATVTVTSGDASSANPAYVGLLVNRYDAAGHSVDAGEVTWFLQGHRTSAGSLSFDTYIPVKPNQRVTIKVWLKKRFAGSASDDWRWEIGAQTVEFNTSIQTDRTPNAPVITHPSTGITMVIGGNDTLDWSPTDDDDASDTDLSALDYRGWQVQYRPGPTVADPDPAWVDPNIRSTILGEGGAARPPYLFDGSDVSDPFAHWYENTALSIVLSATTVAPTILGSGGHVRAILLNAGTWQFRVRSFDDSSGAMLIPNNIVATVPTAVSPWSDPVTVYVIGSTLPPILNGPEGDEGVYGDVTFSWLFQSPIAGNTQRDWSIQVREVGDADYTPIAGGAINDGLSQYTWVNGSTYGGVPFTMVPGHQYEWIATTQDSAFQTSDPSLSATFWYVDAPESGPELPLPEITTPDPGLGCGHNRAFVYARGGKVQLGEITGITKITWTRIRDDISSCDITVNDWSSDCGALLASLRSWQHEIVVFRDNGSGMKRVWEGPIVRPSYEVDEVTIEAKDVMIYPYRRIMRQGYNDAYRKVNGVVQGLTAVTQRAKKIIQNSLAYDDPNVLAYMWVLSRSDDAKQSRVVPDWSRTAWQDVDDMAAKSGLDYTTVGRRIMIWDTHNAIGTLPEMRDGDFDKPPIVTEYGMQLANVYGVTNNNGVWGSAERQPGDFYGYVEMLVSAWGESDDNGTPDTLTAEAAAALKVTLNGQADRGIAQRWPTPVIVRVPDNSTLSPELSIGINELIPGVHIPLQSTSTLRRVRQTQKLDRVQVTEDSNGEKVQVTMSPAPTSRDYDPDEDPFGDDA